jgi:uncharacterized protein (TIRG00374 family)
VNVPEKPGALGRAARRLRDPRVLIGFAITGVALWFALRGVDFRKLGGILAGTNLWILLGLSVPAYLAMLWSRGLRWGHLTRGLTDVDERTMFRGVAVGFMANNLFPLRMGEFVRAWYVAREVGASRAAIFGTVIVERIIDAAIVAGMAAMLLGLGGAAAAGVDARAVLAPVVTLALVPLAGVVALRVAPERCIDFGTRWAGLLLPARWSAVLRDVLENLVEGLRGLRGRHAFVWVVFHSLLIWAVISAVPVVAALWALDIDLGPPERTVLAVYSLLVWVGVAVAIPSAPGFFGPYHAACWFALAPFGVPKEQAIALGTLAHGVFWLTTTGVGLLVLRSRHISPVEIDEVV